MGQSSSQIEVPTSQRSIKEEHGQNSSQSVIHSALRNTNVGGQPKMEARHKPAKSEKSKLAKAKRKAERKLRREQQSVRAREWAARGKGELYINAKGYYAIRLYDDRSLDLAAQSGVAGFADKRRVHVKAEDGVDAGDRIGAKKCKERNQFPAESSSSALESKRKHKRVSKVKPQAEITTSGLRPALRQVLTRTVSADDAFPSHGIADKLADVRPHGQEALASRNAPLSTADMSRKRKRDLPVIEGVTEDSSNDEVKSKDQRTTQNREDDLIKGAFTQEEKDRADAVFQRVLKCTGLSDAQLRAQIQNYANAEEFRKELSEAFPKRNKAALRRFCRRRYHDKQRGPWTEEQDEALRNAYSDYPDLWVRIADLVDRTAEDCRDRWRTYLKHGDSRKTGPWSKDQEHDLLQAVSEVVKRLKDDYVEDEGLIADSERLAQLISWPQVADLLGGRRNRKQCRSRWRVLMDQGKRVETPTSERLSRRDMKAQALIRQFGTGDFYDVFVEIHAAFDDPSRVFGDENSVLYSKVGLQNPDSRFNITQMGGVLRRMAMKEALGWNIENEKVRRRLNEASTTAAKALILAKWVEKTNNVDMLVRKFRPECIGKKREEMQAYKQQNSRRGRTAFKSREYVELTDDDDDRDGGGDETGGGELDVGHRRGAAKRVGPDDDEEEEEEHDGADGDEIIAEEVSEKDVSISSDSGRSQEYDEGSNVDVTKLLDTASEADSEPDVTHAPNDGGDICSTITESYMVPTPTTQHDLREDLFHPSKREKASRLSHAEFLRRSKNIGLD